MSLRLTPITLREADVYVDEHHRHHKAPQGPPRPPKAPQGGLFAVAVSEDDLVRGVAIIGRPVSRMLADGWTAEVTRVCTDGVRNGCSMLYAAAW